MINFITKINFNNAFILIITCILGILFYLPLADFIPYIVQGDIGRDLYVFQQTASGQIPYRDFYWPYGPLMLYYYAFWFKVLGVSITSVLIGKIFLEIIAGLIIYACVRLFTRPVIASLAALYFWAFNIGFTHTFNHHGAIPFVLFSLYLLLYRQRNPGARIEPLLAITTGLIYLVKPNIGIFITISNLASYVFIRRDENRIARLDSKDCLWIWLTISLSCVLLIYCGFFLGLPRYFILQYIPILPTYANEHVSLYSLLNVLWQELTLHFTVNHFNIDAVSTFNRSIAFTFTVITSLFLFIALTFDYRSLRKRDLNSGLKRSSPVLILLIAISMLLAEFVLSATCYRLLWVTPVLILLFFILYALSEGVFSPFLKRVFILSILTLTFSELLGRFEYKSSLEKRDRHFLAEHHSFVYLNNSAQWVEVVSEASREIIATVSPNQKFLAIPYDPLYYYLTDRRSAVPELIFSSFLNISTQQESRLIFDIEKEKIPLILISNRSFSTEVGLGVFGIDYCRELALYIENHYKLVNTIGDWSSPGGWINNHAVRLYKRK